MGLILAVLKHSGKIPSDNQLLKSIETVGAIKEAKILYINTGIFMRSVDFVLLPTNWINNFFTIRGGAEK